jgi:hypothetical protein
MYIWQTHIIPPYMDFTSPKSTLQVAALLSSCVQEIQIFHADFTNDTLVF